MAGVSGQVAIAGALRRDPGRTPAKPVGVSLTLLCMMATAAAVAAPKTDVVLLVNGDRITGEIKKLERGLLTLKTNALGTVQVEWPEVARIETQQRLEIKDSARRRHLGHVASSEAGGQLLLAGEGDAPPSTLPMASLVEITPLSEGAWWDRIGGRASLGLSAASANEDKQLSASLDLQYRDEARSLDAEYAGAWTRSKNNPGLQRHAADVLYRWFPSERRFWGAMGSIARNDELDLELRTLAGFGAGRHWLRDTGRELWGFVGIAATREHYGRDGTYDHVEAVLQGNLDIFRFDDPEIDLSLRLTLYPSLSVPSRVRSEWSLQARMEFLKDFYYEVSYLRSQDSKPPNADGRRIDWSIVSAFGYKF